jgi:hypothetical protein
MLAQLIRSTAISAAQIENAFGASGQHDWLDFGEKIIVAIQAE